MHDKLAHEERQLRAAVMLNAEELHGILFWFRPRKEKLNAAEIKLYDKLKKTLKYLEAME